MYTIPEKDPSLRRKAEPYLALGDLKLELWYFLVVGYIT